MDERVDVDPDAKAGSAEELFLVFLKLGLTSFERQQSLSDVSRWANT